MSTAILERKPTAVVPVAGLSIFDPVDFGLNEIGVRYAVPLIYHNLLIGGEPGAGKSMLLNAVVAHAALCPEVRLFLLDGKLVELGMWAPVAEQFVGPDITEAIELLSYLQSEMEERYGYLWITRRRKLERDNLVFQPMAVAVDEIAYYTATVGSKDQQEQFMVLLRDLVARGRAVGLIVIGATQRPTAEVILPSLRDIFGYRAAFRCTTDTSSDVILGRGWAQAGYTAMDIAPEARGVCWLLAEGRLPIRIKTPYFSDEDIEFLVRRSVCIRRLGKPAHQTLESTVLKGEIVK
jgi:DNA segregation ATPase FtsK/SpoIIIE, S-DNA-T family